MTSGTTDAPPPDTYTNLVEGAYQRDDSRPDTTIITSLYLNLSQDLLPSNRHLVVYADVIAIKGALKLPPGATCSSARAR